jgi:hypothetical protein
MKASSYGPRRDPEHRANGGLVEIGDIPQPDDFALPGRELTDGGPELRHRLAAGLTLALVCWQERRPPASVLGNA